MRNGFYPKMAITNIQKNSKSYLPYMLTCIGTVAMFYMIASLSQNGGLASMSGGSTIRTILFLGTQVTGIFAVVFLFYTNSFLMKQRKKEFGLYNILGMEKRHISRVILCETAMIAGASILSGLLIGILLDKAMFLALLRLFRYEIPFAFEISMKPIWATLTLFAGIFLLIFLSSMLHVHLSKPIDLLKGGQVGEREPKTKWILTTLGLICLAAGYYTAITTTNPLSAIPMFFFAVILVILGTYFLFTAGSIALLKILRKNKGYYYQTKHFISVSGMMYRMKQNAVGLANICILSTAVLVMISSTLSMFIGIEDILQTRYPRNIQISTTRDAQASAQQTNGWIGEALKSKRLAPQNEMRCTYLSFVGIAEGDYFSTDQSANLFSAADNIRNLFFIPLEEYNQLSGEVKTLEDGEILCFSNRAAYSAPTLRVFDLEFTVREVLADFEGKGILAADIVSSHFIVVKDMAVIDRLYVEQKAAYGDRASEITEHYGFDLNADSETIVALYHQLKGQIRELDSSGSIECRDEAENDFLSMYGGLFFIGVFLGVLFIMATILIIYYKQISEGYEDKGRFDILQKVGMSKDEIRKSIGSQVLTVFFLPLVTAGVHMAFAFPAITRLLSILNLTNIRLFTVCALGCFAVFAVLYSAVYSMTARAYYKIVS